MIEIIKLKVKDSSVEVHYNDTDKENNTAEIQARYSQIPHKDLINAMKNMTKHLAMLCDLKESDEVRMCDDFEEFDLSKLPNLEVTGISIGGDGEHSGVTITGMKKLKSGKVINLNSPFTKYFDKNDPYYFEEYLFNDVSRCINEVTQYMNGKWAIKQLEIEFKNE